MDAGPAVAGDLARGFFGADLSPHAVVLLNRLGRIVAYDEGATIVREGQPADPFGIVLEGRVALRLLVPERGAVTVLTVEPGDVVGWSALVAPYRSTSTAVAVAPTRLLAFEPAALRNALRDDPALAASVCPRVLAAVARRLGATRQQLLDLYGREAPAEPW